MVPTGGAASTNMYPKVTACNMKYVGPFTFHLQTQILPTADLEKDIQIPKSYPKSSACTMIRAGPFNLRLDRLTESVRSASKDICVSDM